MSLDKFERSTAEPRCVQNLPRLPFSYNADGDIDFADQKVSHVVATKSYVEKTLQNITKEVKAPLNVEKEPLYEILRANKKLLIETVKFVTDNITKGFQIAEEQFNATNKSFTNTYNNFEGRQLVAFTKHGNIVCKK